MCDILKNAPTIGGAKASKFAMKQAVNTTKYGSNYALYESVVQLNCRDCHRLPFDIAKNGFLVSRKNFECFFGAD